MQKIRETLANLAEWRINTDKRLDHHDEIFEWVAKLIIGTVILSLLGLVIILKK